MHSKHELCRSFLFCVLSFATAMHACGQAAAPAVEPTTNPAAASESVPKSTAATATNASDHGAPQNPNTESKATGSNKAKTNKPQKNPKENRFLRIVRKGGKHDDRDADPTSLQTSICRFRSTDGEQFVDLVGAVHIGEKSYYRTLNRRFRTYDALLYELVAPEGTRVPKGGGEPGSAVGYMQSGMTQMLGLAYQLQEVDYSPANFVHADMTPQEFSASMKRREESVAKMFFRAMGQALVQQTQPEHQGQDARMLAALMADNRELAMRRLLADQFADLDGANVVFGGPDGSTLITERNKKALRIMQKQMDAGKKKIGIFYGAGHLDDMAERLEKEFGMELVKTEWITAWDLRDK